MYRYWNIKQATATFQSANFHSFATGEEMVGAGTDGVTNLSIPLTAGEFSHGAVTFFGPGLMFASPSGGASSCTQKKATRRWPRKIAIGRNQKTVVVTLEQVLVPA